MLSFVEFYKPKFFLLENVLGLLSHRLQINKPGPQEGDTVANGIIKFILRTLTSLGYVIAVTCPRRGTRRREWRFMIAIRSVSMCYRLESTGRPRIVVASSSGAHGAALPFPSSRSRHIISTRRSGACCLTQVSSLSPSPATQKGHIVARLSAP